MTYLFLLRFGLLAAMLLRLTFSVKSLPASKITSALAIPNGSFHALITMQSVLLIPILTKSRADSLCRRFDFCRRPTRFFLILFCCFWLNAAIRAATYELCWQNSEVETASTSLAAAPDKIFVPENNGSLLALDAATGAVLWRAELGGEIAGQISVNSESVFVVTRFNRDAAQKPEQPFAAVRALSIATGVTAWRVELPDAATANAILAANVLTVQVKSGGGGRITALSPATGKQLWTQTTAQPTTFLTALKDRIYFGTDDKKLYSFLSADGSGSKIFALPLAPNQITAHENSLYLSDAAGNVAAIRADDGKKLWKLRLGAALQQILIMRDGVLLASLDNFIYFHRATNGKRIWRKRTANRPIGAIRADDENFAVVATGEHNLILLNTKQGDFVAQMPLRENGFAVAAPLLADGRLIVATDNGILAFAAQPADCLAKEKKAQ